jgi:hypothetical protein
MVIKVKNESESDDSYQGEHYKYSSKKGGK